MSALEIILAVLLILSSVILTVVILMQESRHRAGASGRPARPFPVLFYCFIFLLSPLHTLLPDGSSHPEYPGFRRCP